MQEVGVIAEQKAMDPEIIYKHSGNNVFRMWEKVEPIVQGIRERYNPTMWLYFENLYNEMKKIQKCEQET